ncbi:MAG: hypothetical protein KJO31_07250 [Gammaproteobacteria bacterium]|nr:hypothetical protein [Gammaproteobacteria bacterium]
MTCDAIPFSLETDDIGAGRRCRILHHGSRISFADLLTSLANDGEFADWYSRKLALTPCDAVFWEHPALTGTNLDAAAQFVLLDAPALAAAKADPGPFANVFAESHTDEPVRFASLGKDALLVAPGPGIGRAAAPHLLAFLRNAHAAQIRLLWRTVATATLETISDKPLWLSTSGLGVCWLHIRLDSRPKYYQHRPYRSANYLAEC